ncbi:MAG: hypothetical protein A3J97_05650 [Spirochaetes bacterium RIFOXYC1_FULL_54_7]|nr:MAG: hypothetical protein A3J97_05650 [Spirochaetes bacterium RIFOXYC1_FULL_54_7]
MIEPSPLLVETGGGFSLRHGARWLYSRYQPRLAPEKAALDISADPDTLYVVVSPCLCYGLSTLFARLPSSSALLGVELEASLLQIAKDAFSDLNLEPARSRMVDNTLPEKILGEAASIGKFRRVKEVRLSGGKDLHPTAYDALIEAITVNNRLAWRNRMTLVRLGRLWVKNVIANLANLPWEQVVPPVPTYKPVMLCGAGPSLDKVLPWLKKHATQLTIIAVDTAAGALAQAGILPDRVVCLEAQAHNLPDFTPLAGLELTLVADISAHPASFRIVRGPKNLVSSQWMNSGFLDRLSNAGLPIQPVPPLGSVGVLAARLAVQQGQILFVAGLDFSFFRGITHCTGSPSDLAERRLETRLYKQNRNWALSYGHGVVSQTGGSLGNAILSMYAACAGVELQDADVFDLRGGFGLPLPAKPISLEQAGELLATIPVTGYGSLQAAAQGESKGVMKRTAAKAFLENELHLAQYLSRSLHTGDKGLTADIIREFDYMYAHFPDPDRVEAMELDALKRLALEAAYWQRRLQMALSTLQS